MVNLEVISKEAQIFKSTFFSPVGPWNLLWSEEGIVRITSAEDVGFCTLSEDIPDWLDRAWAEFWSGSKVNVTFCTYREPPLFTARVYDVVYSIPFGSTLSYAEVASLAGNARASRAVGTIMRNNPWALFVPCHRVIGSDGSMRGYGGPKGIELKRALLDYERKNKS